MGKGKERKVSRSIGFGDEIIEDLNGVVKGFIWWPCAEPMINGTIVSDN